MKNAIKLEKIFLDFLQRTENYKKIMENNFRYKNFNALEKNFLEFNKYCESVKKENWPSDKKLSLKTRRKEIVEWFKKLEKKEDKRNKDKIKIIRIKKYGLSCKNAKDLEKFKKPFEKILKIIGTGKIDSEELCDAVLNTLNKILENKKVLSEIEQSETENKKFSKQIEDIRKQCINPTKAKRKGRLSFLEYFLENF
jgi:hypothetical protein